jgi:prepilin-type N-terminal cleavage/methylation domain-containing protein
MNRNLKKGFTLIELLVVIAIIGILSAVVLASLNSARNRAKDASIQSSMSSLRGYAETFYSGNNSYTGLDAPAAGGAEFTDLEVDKIDDAINGQIGVALTTQSLECNVSSTGTAYACSAPLATTGGGFFCIDSASVAKKHATALGTTATSCP